MQEIEEISYHNIIATLVYFKESRSFMVKWESIKSDMFYTAEETIIDYKKNLDIFLAYQPKTWEELAEKLTSSLTWAGYENCYLDSSIANILITNFLKVNGITLKQEIV